MSSFANIINLVKAQLFLDRGKNQNVYAGLLMLAIFESTTGALRTVMPWIKNHVQDYVKKRFQNRIQDAVMAKVEPQFAELFFERNYSKQDIWDRADAVIHQVLKIPASQVVLVIGQLEIVKNGREFEVEPDMKFQLVSLKLDEKGNLEHIKFRLFSEVLTVCELREYVDGLVETYLINKKNNLGTKTFYFDHIVEKPHPRMPPSKKVLFSKYFFCTSRTLENVFHERQEELKHRVEFFLNNKGWYDKRGIPHTLGLLLHGSPGTGKTSTIKAIANIAKRHIVNINLSAIKTRKQLKKLFYDERIEVCENMANTANITEYIIPIDKRIYVIEDIDAIDSDLLLKRSTKEANIKETITMIDDPPPGPIGMAGSVQFTNEVEDTADLDLSTILNTIDGTLETPGRILIISSNYPEKLDEALIRPGRIDMLIEYKKCNHKMLVDMFRAFFETEPDAKLIGRIPEYSWTPAEVSQVLFKNFGDPERALNELVEIDPKEYFKFSHTETPALEEEQMLVTEREPESVSQPEQRSESTTSSSELAEKILSDQERHYKEIQRRRFEAQQSVHNDFENPPPEPLIPIGAPPMQISAFYDGFVPSESGYAFAGLEEKQD